MAKKYSFRLQTVLRLRKTTEDECRRRVADRLRTIAQVESDVRHLGEQHDWEVERSRAEQLGPGMDVLTVRRRRGYMGHLRRRKHACEAHIRSLREKLDQEQRALAQASKEVKALEKLRDRQWERHRAGQLRAERAEEDEIGQQMFMRRRLTSTG